MQGEYERGEGAAPDCRRCAFQDRKDKHAAEHVERDVYQVVGPALKAEKLAIQHVREPSQRNPVPVVGRSERPAHSLPR